MQRCRLKADRKNGFSATVSARALNVDGVSFAEKLRQETLRIQDALTTEEPR